MEEDYKKRLLEILYEKSFRYDPAGGFRLASGRKSHVYIDSKKTVLSAEAMVLVGRNFFEMIKDIQGLEGIGGLTLGADPIAYATAFYSNMHKKPLSVFIVRKEIKAHGTKRAVEGDLGRGARVVIVDDVVTTGASTIKAIESALEEGFEIKKVVALVDREEGGRENIQKRIECPFEALFKKSDLMRLHRQRAG